MMVGSIGFGEIMLIVLVVLIVFGPHRLPEMARRIGELLARARRATQEFTEALDAEFDDTSGPLRDLRTEYESTKRQLTDSANKLTERMAPASPVEDGPGNRDPAANVEQVVEGDVADPDQDLPGVSGTP